MSSTARTSIFGSILAKISLILLAMGAALAAAIGIGWVVFGTVKTSVNDLQRNSLPQIEASAALIDRTSLVRDQFQAFGASESLNEVEERGAALALGLATLEETVASFDPARTAELSALVASLQENSNAVGEALSARFDARESLNAQLSSFQEMAAQARTALEAQGALAVTNLNDRSEETVATVRETLTALTDKEFVELTNLLNTRAELNLLTGLAIARGTTQDNALQSVMADLAQAGLTRLDRSLETVLSVPALTEALAPVVAARDYLANTNPRSLDRTTLFRLRQESDAALSQIMDDRTFALTILAFDVSDQNETVIRNLIDQEVGALKFASEMEGAVKDLLLAVLTGAAAPTLAEIDERQDVLTMRATDLNSLSTETALSEAVAGAIAPLLASSDPDAGVLASRRAYLNAAAQVSERIEEATRELMAMADAAQNIASLALGDVLQTSASVSDHADAGAARLQHVAVAGLVIFLVSTFAAWGFILRPISGVTRVTERLSGGDLSPIEGFERQGGEIGRLANALTVFRSSMIERQEFEAAEKEREAKAREREAAKEADRRREEAAAAERQKQQEAAARAEADRERQEMISSLSKSLGSVVSAASAGDFSKRVDVNFADAKLVALASDVNALVDNVEIGITAAGTVLERVAQGDLSEEMGGEFQGAFKDLKDNTNAMIRSLKDLIGGITASTDNLAQSSRELRDTSAELSKQSEQNAAALEESSSGLEELSASIKQIDTNVSEANKNAQITSETARNGQAVASEAAEAMKRINAASDEISNVVSVINDISFQINLLALNAGVEAARAGDAGRGFAVVASEVRQLSHRASEASNEIAAVMARSDSAVADGVAKVKDAEASLEKIATSVVEVSGSIEVIARAISEQVGGVSDINAAVAQIDQNTQRATASFEEVTAASALLSGEADTLKQATSRFKTGSSVVGMPKTAGAKPLATKSPSAQFPTSGNLAELPDDWEDF